MAAEAELAQSRHGGQDSRALLERIHEVCRHLWSECDKSVNDTWQAEAECERLRDQVEAQLVQQDTSEDPVIATLRRGKRESVDLHAFSNYLLRIK